VRCPHRAPDVSAGEDNRPKKFETLLRRTGFTRTGTFFLFLVIILFISVSVSLISIPRRSLRKRTRKNKEKEMTAFEAAIFVGIKPSCKTAGKRGCSARLGF
jgi:hypothetical protein